MRAQKTVGGLARTVISHANRALALNLDTLLKLSESTSYDLRAAYADYEVIGHCDSN